MGTSTTASLTPVSATVADPGDIGTARGGARAAALTLVVLGSFINLLIPIERGFPLLSLGGLQFPFPLILNLLVFGALFLARPIQTAKSFRHPPLFWQGVISLFLLFRAVFSPELGMGMATALIYIGVFVGQFALLLAVMNWVGRSAFARAYLWCAAIAAILGILEGLFRYLLPPYQLIRILHSLSRGYGDAGMGVGRVDGPPGNSILFAYMMAMSVPFAFEVKTKAIRWTLITLFVLAVALTIARIGYLMLLVFVLGGLLMGGKRAHAAAIGLALALVGGLVAITVFSDHPMVERITGRFSGEGEAVENVRFRTDAIRIAFEATLDPDRPEVAIWGAGIREGDNIGKTVIAKVLTLDNAYITILYEGGALLVFLFVLAYSYHLRRLWTDYGPARLYWFGLIAGLVGGIAFVSFYTIGANYPFVACMAVLGHERNVRIRARKAAARATLGPAQPAPA